VKLKYERTNDRSHQRSVDHGGDLAFNGEDADGGMLTAHRRIIREPGKPPTLGPLHIDENILQSEGRYVGMLPPRRDAKVQ
jgi:hypothetical protein